MQCTEYVNAEYLNQFLSEVRLITKKGSVPKVPGSIHDVDSQNTASTQSTEILR